MPALLLAAYDTARQEQNDVLQLFFLSEMQIHVVRRSHQRKMPRMRRNASSEARKGKRFRMHEQNLFVQRKEQKEQISINKKGRPPLRTSGHISENENYR